MRQLGLAAWKATLGLVVAFAISIGSDGVVASCSASYDCGEPLGTIGCQCLGPGSCWEQGNPTCCCSGFDCTTCSCSSGCG